jgi:hypothetical protein
MNHELAEIHSRFKKHNFIQVEDDIHRCVSCGYLGVSEDKNHVEAGMMQPLMGYAKRLYSLDNKMLGNILEHLKHIATRPDIYAVWDTPDGEPRDRKGFREFLCSCAYMLLEVESLVGRDRARARAVQKYLVKLYEKKDRGTT